MKVDEIAGATLDYWVARANGLNPEIVGNVAIVDRVRFGTVGVPEDRDYVVRGRYSPSTKWDEAGPIIEREGICISPHGHETWGAWITSSCYESNSPDALGDTPLVAAMRAYVVAKFGREVGL